MESVPEIKGVPLPTLDTLVDKLNRKIKTPSFMKEKQKITLPETPKPTQQDDSGPKKSKAAMILERVHYPFFITID